MADKRCQCVIPVVSHTGGRCLSCGGPTVIRYTTRYFCPHKDVAEAGAVHSSGSGKPKRKLCAGCGGTLRTVEGRWGVFVWTGDNRYPASAAESIRMSEAAAKRRAGLLNEADYGAPWVARWIPRQG